MSELKHYYTTGSKPESVAHVGIPESAAMTALTHGPRGALIIAGCAVALLFVGWLFFYFVLFMSRGYVG